MNMTPHPSSVKIDRIAAGGSPLPDIQKYIAANGSSIGELLSARFSIRTLAEAERLSTMLACHCPNPERTAPGIWELLANAIEHGNLGIPFEEKTRLLREGTFHSEVQRRLDLTPYRERRVLVEFDRGAASISIVITDQGDGFDFMTALETDWTIDLPNGRGIAIASRLSFDTLAYKGSGNCVEATISVPA